jgi:site-specific recombinase XerD
LRERQQTGVKFSLGKDARSKSISLCSIRRVIRTSSHQGQADSAIAQDERAFRGEIAPCRLEKAEGQIAEHATHHDLRHLFATTCIESGVDIPTVSRWLGHKDGGALAMKVYGHLRDKHSANMAQRVSFDAAPKADNIVSLPESQVG